jgi:copper chaperone CopZ
MKCYRASVITTLRISGMTCNGCVRHVDKALRGVAGVTAVEVSLPEQRATISHAETAPIASLVAAVESAGYTASASP